MQLTMKLTEPHQEEPPVEPEQEASTAVALREEPIIEGEVTEVIEPKQQPPRYPLLVLATILVCLVFLAVLLVLPLLTPSATVTIIPSEKQLLLTTVIPIPARVLPALTLSQRSSVQPTGKRHQNAIHAQGTITFYNGLFTSQTIASGTVLTGNDGVQVVTDQSAVIPSGNPPIYGQISVSAHAVQSGSQRNIPAYDMNTACCLTSVLAKNTQAFTGGADARDYLVVTQHDFDTAAATILSTLEKSERAALTAQLNPGEAFITPACSNQVKSDHQPGDEATEVTVTVSETCTAAAYDSSFLQEKATQLLTQQAITQLGIHYTLMGSIQVSILHATIADQARGSATIAVKLDGTYIYQLSQSEQQHLKRLIAGKNKQQAVRMLLQSAEIQAASITSNTATIPEDPGRITLVIVYRSA